jgi:6-phosphogluconate dehydrogenase
MQNNADIAVVGLAVMGENLILNMESKGFTVACFNRTTSKVDTFVDGRAAGKDIIGCRTIEELIATLKQPRKVMCMIKAGRPVDAFIASVMPFLEAGDVIIDGGNSHFSDTTRRVREVENTGLRYIGGGISRGEEGALTGPSIMPGGSPAAWEALQPIFQTICAFTDNGHPCCDWVGEGGAGHFVKMVHNGIEYGDMQLIGETYQMMKDGLLLSNQQMAGVFARWNQGPLDSYLIDITHRILGHKDGNEGRT